MVAFHITVQTYFPYKHFFCCPVHQRRQGPTLFFRRELNAADVFLSSVVLSIVWFRISKSIFNYLVCREPQMRHFITYHREKLLYILSEAWCSYFYQAKMLPLHPICPNSKEDGKETESAAFIGCYANTNKKTSPDLKQ